MDVWGYHHRVCFDQNRDLMKAKFDAAAAKEGKTMSRKLGELNKDEMSDLMDIFATYCL